MVRGVSYRRRGGSGRLAISAAQWLFTSSEQVNKEESLYRARQAEGEAEAEEEVVREKRRKELRKEKQKCLGKKQKGELLSIGCQHYLKLLQIYFGHVRNGPALAR